MQLMIQVGLNPDLSSHEALGSSMGLESGLIHHAPSLVVAHGTVGPEPARLG